MILIHSVVKNGTIDARNGVKKHRRKNKHHSRGSHSRSRPRQKKNRTRPTDILVADDENEKVLPLSAVMTVHGGSGSTGSKGAQIEQLPVPRRGKNNKKNPRARGTRHLELNSDTPRKFTNGHAGERTVSDRSYKPHRRRRFHHKKAASSKHSFTEPAAAAES
jgi:hypothetical protein